MDSFEQAQYQNYEFVVVGEHALIGEQLIDEWAGGE